MAIDVNSLIAGYDPTKYGYTRNTDGSKPNGWYLNGAESPSSPYGGGGSFEDYLNQNGVRMWDPGNPSWGRVGVTNKQAFDYLNPGAQILGTGSQFSNADPSLGTTQFYTGGGPALGTALANRDYGDHSGINGIVEKIGPMIPLAFAGAAGAGLLGGGLGGESLGGGLTLDQFGNVGGGLFQGGSIAASDGLAATGASSMFDPFDPSTWNLLDQGTSGAFDQGGSTGFGGSTPTNTPSWMQDYFKDFTPGTFDGPGSPVAGDVSGLGGPNGGSLIQNAIKSLLSSGAGGTQSGGLSKLLQSLGLGGGISDFLGSAAQTAPVLAALNYARNQNPIDTGPLTNLANQYDPKAQALSYDLDTAHQRTALDASLTARGVAGSSFGNFDQASFDTLRGLGRSNLINQGAGTQAGIYGLINQGNLQSQQLKNQLLGSGLNALGLMANPNRGITLPA